LLDLRGFHGSLIGFAASSPIDVGLHRPYNPVTSSSYKGKVFSNRPALQGPMKIDVRSFQPRAWRRRIFLAAAAAALSLGLLSQPLMAQSLQPVKEDGHVVWTNDTPSLSGTPSAAEEVSQTELVYWSNIEKRWKPVRPASPRAMRKARAVAGEVSSYIESRPALDAADATNASRTQMKGEPASEDPNYSQAAGNRSVSASQIDRYINEAAARHHVDSNLVRALIKVESNFNPRALSSKGAMGLMQLMPATARRYEVRNPFDAAQNVDAGVRHLKGLLQNFGGDVRLTLAAYNAGEGAVQRSGGIPPYTETRNYVKRITGIMAGGVAPGIAAASIPIQLRRDERGRLVISNTD
jgi:soluble lytic murein transglycosylase-like protein